VDDTHIDLIEIASDTIYKAVCDTINNTHDGHTLVLLTALQRVVARMIILYSKDADHERLLRAFMYGVKEFIPVMLEEVLGPAAASQLGADLEHPGQGD
jgi:hypothetical protein